MKGAPIPVRARLTSGYLPGGTALVGALPRGRVPIPRSLWRWAFAQATAPRLRDRNRGIGLALHQHLQRRLFGKRSASGRRR